MNDISSIKLFKNSIKFINSHFTKILILMIISYLPANIIQYILKTITLKNYNIYLFKILSEIGFHTIFAIIFQILIVKYSISIINKNIEIRKNMFDIILNYIPIIIMFTIIGSIKELMVIIGVPAQITVFIYGIMNVIMVVLSVLCFLILEEIILRELRIIEAFKQSVKDIKVKIDAIILFMVISAIIIILSNLLITLLQTAIGFRIIEENPNIFKDILLTMVTTIINGFVLTGIIFGKCTYVNYVVEKEKLEDIE